MTARRPWRRADEYSQLALSVSRASHQRALSRARNRGQRQPRVPHIMQVIADESGRLHTPRPCALQEVTRDADARACEHR